MAEQAPRQRAYVRVNSRSLFLTQVEVDCGKWDVKLVAEADSECQVEDINLCKAAQWNIVADCHK